MRGEVRRAPLGGPVGFSSAFFVHGLEPPLPRLALYFQSLGAPAVALGIHRERLADGLLPGALRGLGPSLSRRALVVSVGAAFDADGASTAAKARRFSRVSRRSKAQPSAWKSSVESHEFLSG